MRVADGGADASLTSQHRRAKATLRKLTTSELVITSLAAGATAGAIAKTIIAPLDRTKIIFQISKSKYSTREALKFVVRSYRNEGLLSLWRGNSATMARIVPYAALQFSAHEQWKRVLGLDQNNGDKHNSELKRFLAGSLAGLTGQSLTYPLDMARARMAVTKKHRYGSLRQTFVTIWREEGPLTLYRGVTPTLLGVIPYAGTSFLIYETLKRKHAELWGTSGMNPLQRMLYGALAGLAGQTFSYPLDIVRRRMQTSRLEDSPYRTVLGTLRRVYREEGLRHGLFKGVTMNWIKGPVAVGISFSTYDTVLSQLHCITRWINP